MFYCCRATRILFMKMVKIGDTYLNLDNVTHVQFETSAQGLMCTVFLDCQITDRNGCNGIQACKTFTAVAAKDLKAVLDGTMSEAQQS
jgi:hypothetical protein